MQQLSAVFIIGENYAVMLQVRDLFATKTIIVVHAAFFEHLHHYQTMTCGAAFLGSFC